MTPRKPILDELAAWEVLTTAAVSHAEAVTRLAASTDQFPSAEAMISARKAVRGMVLPEGQQMAGSPMVLLLKAVDKWAVLNRHDRHVMAAELRDAGIAAARASGFRE